MARKHVILISMLIAPLTQGMDNGTAPASGDSSQEFACIGDGPELFMSPLDREVLIRRPNRVLPLKLRLFDANAVEISDQQVDASPVVQVMFLGKVDGNEMPDELKNPGRGDEGNSFKYRNDRWQFSLSTREYSAPGRYSVTVEAGDDSYIVDPACMATFVVQ